MQRPQIWVLIQDYFLACCRLIAQMAGPLLSHVT